MASRPVPLTPELQTQAEKGGSGTQMWVHVGSEPCTTMTVCGFPTPRAGLDLGAWRPRPRRTFTAGRPDAQRAWRKRPDAC